MLAEKRVTKLWSIIFLHMSEYNVTPIVGKYDEHEMFVLLPERENQ